MREGGVGWSYGDKELEWKTVLKHLSVKMFWLKKISKCNFVPEFLVMSFTKYQSK